MNYLFGFIIFACVVFTYIHIMHQYKRSHDLEIYEMDYSNNAHLQEICDMKQPVIFEFESIVPAVFENGTLEYMSNKYGPEILYIKDSNDYYNRDDENKSVDSVPMKCVNAYKVLQNDAGSHYYTENNSWFLEESTILDKIKMADTYLKPTMNVHSKYDYVTGSDKTTTPLRYHVDYRHYYVITSGKIHVKMTPWKSSTYLHPIKDYENYEFRSTYNAWGNASDDIRFVEFDVAKGDVLYIPPYWWYSIQFTQNTSLYSITYNSLMNVVAYSPQWVLYFIQQQNIFKKETKKVESSISDEALPPETDNTIGDKIMDMIAPQPGEEQSIGV